MLKQLENFVFRRYFTSDVAPYEMLVSSLITNQLYLRLIQFI